MKTVSVRLTESELRLLRTYWPADVENMGDADANDPQNRIQPVGRRITDKLNEAQGAVDSRRPMA